jgi:hypothetical protein
MQKKLNLILKKSLLCFTLLNLFNVAIGQTLWTRSGTTLYPTATNDKIGLGNITTATSAIQYGITTSGIDDNLMLVHPSNYNTALKQGRFSMSVGDFNVNGTGVRHNVVGNFWGYNTNPGGGQEIPGEASYRFAGETHYLIAGNPNMEFHLPEIFTNSGTSQRPLSLYINKESGFTNMNMQVSQFSYKKYNDINTDWMVGNLVNNKVTVSLYGQSTGGIQGSAEFYLQGKQANGTANYLTFGNNGTASYFLSGGPFAFNNYFKWENMDADLYASESNNKSIHLHGGSQGSHIIAYGQSHPTYANWVRIYTGLYDGGNITLGAQNQDAVVINTTNNTVKISSLATGGTPPSTTGTTKYVIADANGLLSLSPNYITKVDDNENILSNGKIAIGIKDVNKTGTYSLFVNGSAFFTKAVIKPSASPWPDYVFNKDYKLPTLEEIEKYITAHGHLPDIPSKDDIEKNGIDVADNQCLLLKKIEELTLLLIEQDKRIKMLEKKGSVK